MKQSELAAAFGITSGAISQCVKRGMPTTSVEAAQRWREAYLNPLKAKQNPIGAFQIRWRQIEALRESDMDITPLLPGLRVALRAIPKEQRDIIKMSVELWDALTAHCTAFLSEEVDATPLSPDDAESMGLFWYSVACGELE